MYAMCVIRMTLRTNNLFIMDCSAYDKLRNVYLPHLSNLHKDFRVFNRLMSAE